MRSFGTAWSRCVIVSVLLVCVAACSRTENTEALRDEATTVTGGEPFHGLLPYRAKDAKLSLVQPVFVHAEDAQLPDGVSVVGVSVDGTDRAYPLYVLKNHQVVNDRLGDLPVAASW